MKLDPELMHFRHAKNPLFKRLAELIPIGLVAISFFLYLTNQDKRIAVNEANLSAIVTVNQSQDVHLQHIEYEVDELYRIMIDKEDKK